MTYPQKSFYTMAVEMGAFVFSFDGFVCGFCFPGSPNDCEVKLRLFPAKDIILILASSSLMTKLEISPSYNSKP